RPRVFVGSSVEGLDEAYAVQEALQYTAEITIWTQGVFNLTSNALDDLIDQLLKTDVAIFIFSPDDVTKMRDHQFPSVRDNVILQFGLFLGRLGKKRTFFIIPRMEPSFHLPSDLAGVTPADYDPTRDNLQAALGPACSKIGCDRRMMYAGFRAAKRPLT